MPLVLNQYDNLAQKQNFIPIPAENLGEALVTEPEVLEVLDKGLKEFKVRALQKLPLEVQTFVQLCESGPHDLSELKTEEHRRMAKAYLDSLGDFSNQQFSNYLNAKYDPKNKTTGDWFFKFQEMRCEIDFDKKWFTPQAEQFFINSYGKDLGALVMKKLLSLVKVSVTKNIDGSSISTSILPNGDSNGSQLFELFADLKHTKPKSKL